MPQLNKKCFVEVNIAFKSTFPHSKIPYYMFGHSVRGVGGVHSDKIMRCFVDFFVEFC